MKGRVSEIFLSIQGEGLYAGERQVFVRLADCNLRCKYCDTMIYSFREYEPRALLGELNCYSNNYHSVAFTGGEPLMQKDFLKEVLELTRKAGFKNYLETNGTLPDALAEVIDNLDIVAMDFKLPSSTGSGSFWPQHRKFLEISSRKDVFVKAVICGSTVEEDLRQTLKVISEVNSSAILVLQPDSGVDYAKIEEKLNRFKAICIDENIAVCIIPQIHKVLGLR
jgi:7-carboxy-7-deazaguanine synthase